MTIEQQRRSLLRHGFIFLFGAIWLGLATATLSHPQKWAAAHLTALLTSVVLASIGLAWREFRLTSSQRAVAFACGLVSAYGGLVANVFAAIVNLPGPASNPGIEAPATNGAIFSAMLVVIVPTTSTAFGLALYGMRGDPPCE